jgi:hypothetical protein
VTSPPLALVLAKAEKRLLRRAGDLEARLDGGGDVENVWYAYYLTITCLVKLSNRGERAGELLTTKSLAEKFGVSPRTILRRRKRGELTPALELGQRGRAAVRW